jgi:hypothetical protein
MPGAGGMSGAARPGGTISRLCLHARWQEQKPLRGASRQVTLLSARSPMGMTPRLRQAGGSRACASSGAAASLAATMGSAQPGGSGQRMPIAGSSQRIDASQSFA